MTRSALPDAIHSEGTLLTADFLERLGAGDKSVTALSPEAYHLSGSDGIGDAITRAWNELLGHWRSFAARLEADPSLGQKSSEVLKHWLYPLFQVLGFGRLAPLREPLVVGDASYALSHLWQRVPLHLVAWDQSLDQAVPKVSPRRSPHGLMQDLLNKSDQHLWGIISNGRLLRLMRDHRSLTRQAYVELDLERMFAGEEFHAFRFAWLLLHESRFTSEVPEQAQIPEHFRLEAWFKEAKDEGVRALDKLRVGVEQAIEKIGHGFVSHPANGALIERLREGTLDKQELYRELLRLVYRLIFLFVAEDRDALLVGDDVAKRRYQRFYTTSRLRRRALAGRGRGDRHEDLWQSLRLVMQHLDHGYPPLALPALGSFLWSPTAAPHVMAATLANEDLLAAIGALSSTRDAHGQRYPVSWRLIGADELGGIYESLLELHPVIGEDFKTFTLDTAAGHERKTTGSYYTPSALVECLLDSALDPVIDDAVKGKPPTDAEAAILSLTVVDPAVGSGHFIRAAGRRLARRLAQVRSGHDEPDPATMRRALRDVVGRCLYGVDLNPMAAELCKVALWLEAVEPGRPLTFLDSHIQVGNALLGATPELIAKGVPDAAWEVLTGDDKKVASALKKRNKRVDGKQQLELGGGASLTPSMVDPKNIERARFIEALRQHTRQELGRVEGEWAAYLVSEEYRNKELLADVWCAAFVWPKQTGEPNDAAPVDPLFFKAAKDPLTGFPESTQRIARQLAEQYRFFHWHLRFPAVMASGGFDVVLGNPPWERVKLQELEFFAPRSEEIANARNAAARKKLIASLPRTDSALWAAWSEASRAAEGESLFVRKSGRYPLCGNGDINTYTIFAEHNATAVAAIGRVGVVLPSGIATDDTTKHFFQGLLERNAIVSLWEFENEGFFSAGKGHMLRFALTTLTGPARPVGQADFFFQGQSLAELQDPRRHFRLSRSDIALLNPNTRTCPIFKTERDAELNIAIYRASGVLVNDETGVNPWGVEIRTRLWHMSESSEHFNTREDLQALGGRFDGTTFVSEDRKFLPLLEAKMVHQFNHRHGTFEGVPNGERPHKLPPPSEAKLVDPQFSTTPFYWVDEQHVAAQLAGLWNRKWLLGWRDVTDARASRRTLVPCVVPLSAVSDKFLLMFPSAPAKLAAALYAALSSFALDYAARQKVGGTSLKAFTMKQLPVLPPAAFQCVATWNRAKTVADWFVERVVELTYTAWDMEPFAKDVGYVGHPFRWDAERRGQLRAELDAAIFQMYELARSDIAYILDCFEAVRRLDVGRHDGRFVTKERILDVYDALARATPTKPYVSPMFPPADLLAQGPPSTDSHAVAQMRIATLVRLADDALDLDTLVARYDFAPDTLAALGPAAQTPEAKAWASARPTVPGLRLLLESLFAAQRMTARKRGDRLLITPTEHTPKRAQLPDWFVAEAGVLMTLAKARAQRAVPDHDLVATVTQEVSRAPAPVARIA